MKANRIKLKADKIVNLSSLPIGTMLHKIASVEIRFKGFYTYTDMNTNKKIFVTP